MKYSSDQIGLAYYAVESVTAGRISTATAETFLTAFIGFTPDDAKLALKDAQPDAALFVPTSETVTAEVYDGGN